MSTQNTIAVIPHQGQIEVYADADYIYIEQPADDGGGGNDVIQIAPSNLDMLIAALTQAKTSIG